MVSATNKDVQVVEPVGPGSRRNSTSSGRSTFVDDDKVNSHGQDQADGDLEKTLQIEEAPDAEEQVPEARSLPKPEPPPNGGLQAWTQVLGSFFLFFNTWGLINAFGAFQTYYMADLLKHESASNISWIGSLQSFLILSIGSVAGPVFDAGHFNLLIRSGSFCLVLGLMMTSLCRELWQLVLAQGLLSGIGGGCLFLPAVAIIPQYFTTRKSLATGLASAGSSLGGIIYPVVFHRLQPRIGFPWATRVLGFICLATVLVPCLVMKVRFYPQGRRKILQMGAYKDLGFTLNQIAGFIGFVGFFGPFFYLESYSLAQPGGNRSIAFYLLPIILAGSFFGRIFPNFYADKTGPFVVLVPATIISGMLSLCWIAIKSTSGLIAFAVFYGFFTGGLVSVTPLTVVALTKDFRDLGTRMGMFMTVGALATLIGAPVLGAILNHTHSYLGIQLFCGICLIAAGLIWIPVYVLARRAHAQATAKK